jgi:hypothetical protein
MEDFRDQEIECVDCGAIFTFTVSEQEFFFTRTPPLTRPKRCRSCRAEKRAHFARKDAAFTSADRGAKYGDKQNGTE